MPIAHSGAEWFLICDDCLREGPTGFRSQEARELARAAGWSRLYNGSGEQFRCPTCRGLRPDGGLLAKVLDIVNEDDQTTAGHVAERLGITTSSARGALLTLHRRGSIARRLVYVPLPREQAHVTRLDDYRSGGQFGETGMIDHVLGVIGERSRVAVEFGAGDGIDCSNTVHLWRDNGWKGFLVEPDRDRFEALEGNAGPYETVCIQDMIAPTGPGSISARLADHGITEVDFMSIDVDGADLHIFEALTCRPRLVVVEFNPTCPPHLAIRQPQPLGTFGASLLAFIRAGEKIGYTFIGANYCNAFFVVAEEARHFFRYERDPAVLTGPSQYTYAVTDFAGRAVLVGQTIYWGARDPYVEQLEVDGGSVTMPGDSPQLIRRGFESLWGPATWLTPVGLTGERLVQLFRAGTNLVCIDLTTVADDVQRWVSELAEDHSYRPLMAGRVLGLIRKEPA